MLTWPAFKAGFNLHPPRQMTAWLKTCRWFQSKSETPQRLDIGDGTLMDGWLLCWLRVQLQNRDEKYFIPLRPGSSLPRDPQSHLGTLDIHGQKVVLTDAIQDTDFKVWFARHLSQNAEIPLEHGRLLFVSQTPETHADISGNTISDLDVEQSNTSFVLRPDRIVKIYRKIEAAPNPEAEMLLTLNRLGFQSIPELYAHAVYESREGKMRSSLALMQQYVENQGDAWQYALRRLHSLQAAIPASLQNPDELEQRLHAEAAQDWQRLQELGAVTGTMHYLLGQPSDDPEIQPRVCQHEDIAWMADQFKTSCQRLREAAKTLPAQVMPLWEQMRIDLNQLGQQHEVLNLLLDHHCLLIRTHGDFHLGQVLDPGSGWVIFDFEGEPLRPIRERRRRSCPLRDVAGMLRSLNYAAEVFSAEHPEPQAAILKTAWENLARQYFLKGYQAETLDKGVKFLPSDPTAVRRLIRYFELEKALYELQYEINNRPAWIHVPLAGMARLLARVGP